MTEPYELVNLILNDAIFRHALMSDPEGTLLARGVEPTKEMLNALKGISEEALTQLAHELGTGNLSSTD